MREQSEMSLCLALVATPECHRVVAGLTVAARLYEAFRAAGVRDVVLVSGQGDCSLEGVRRVDALDILEDDKAWIVAKTDVVVDLEFARAVVDRGLRSTEPIRWGRSVWLRLPGGDWDVPSSQEPAPGVCLPLGQVSPWRAKRALVRACRKPLAIDGPVCLAIGRPLSGWLTTFLVETPVSPNLVTGASLVLGLAGAAVAAFGSWRTLGAGATLLFVSWVLDNCDGEIARTKYQGSRWGAWFDIYADFVVNEAFLLGMGVGLSRVFGHWVWAALAGYAFLATSFYNAVVFRTIHRMGVADEFAFQWWFEGGDAGHASGRGLFARLFGAMRYLGRRDTFVALYLVAAWLRLLHWALVATVVGATFTGVLTVLHLFLRSKEAVR